MKAALKGMNDVTKCMKYRKRDCMLMSFHIALGDKGQPPITARDTSIEGSGI